MLVLCFDLDVFVHVSFEEIEHGAQLEFSGFEAKSLAFDRRFDNNFFCAFDHQSLYDHRKLGCRQNAAILCAEISADRTTMNCLGCFTVHFDVNEFSHLLMAIVSPFTFAILRWGRRIKTELVELVKQKFSVCRRKLGKFRHGTSSG